MQQYNNSGDPSKAESNIITMHSDINSYVLMSTVIFYRKNVSYIFSYLRNVWLVS